MMQMLRVQKQQNKQKIKFMKIQKNPDITVWMSGFFCYTTSYIETRICSGLYRDEQKQEW